MLKLENRILRRGPPELVERLRRLEAKVIPLAKDCIDARMDIAETSHEGVRGNSGIAHDKVFFS